MDLFGINNEGTGVQLNYLIDEDFRIKKGPNMVISMLHHHLFTKIPEGKKIILYVDNCSGQNKNQTIVGYLCYLVQILKRYPEISLNFMLVGHTKFSPDCHFGTIKMRGKQVFIRSILDLVGDNGIVRKSAINNDVIT